MDLDDEELKATRRMNGSDKDVGSMEEDIKILKNIIEQDFSNPMGWSGYYDSELKELQQAIKNLIKAYKELEEENEQIEAIKDEAIRRYNFESIPVSLVEEKIEEIKNETWYIDCGVEAKQSCIEVLQELLEKRK